MAKVYTKTGDKGQSGLVSGQRVSKSDYRLDTYGEVDHLNSTIGLFIQNIKLVPEISIDIELFKNMQNKLFNLGSLLACPIEKREEFKLKGILEKDVLLIEKQIDQMEEELPVIKNFILPGGSIPASYAHMCRTQSRNLERAMVKNFTNLDELPENGLKYINRLSDYFFDLARLINYRLKVEETIWEA